MNTGNMIGSIKKRYITWLLLILKFLCIFMYIFKGIFCPNEISEVFKIFCIKCLDTVSFYHGYNCGVNDLKATVGVTIFICNTFAPQIKGIFSVTNPILNTTILKECSNELSAHLAVQHLDVALPSVLTTYYYILKIVVFLLITSPVPTGLYKATCSFYLLD